MFVYILNYTLLFIWSVVSEKKIVVSAIALQMFLILAFRADNLGVDWDNYIREYEYYATYSFKEIISTFRFFSNSAIALGHESGYVLLNWFFHHLNLSYHSLIVFIAAFCIISISFTIYRYSKIPWLSFAIIIALGLYGYMFCILRQSLAVAVLYLSIPFLLNGKKIKFCLMVVLASLFHIVSILFLPLCLFSKIKVNKLNFSIGISITFIIIFIGKFFFKAIFFFFQSMNKGYDLSTLFIWNNMFAFVFMIVSFSFYFTTHKKTTNDKESIFFWILFFSLPVQAIGFYIPIFSRAAIGIFLPISAIILPNNIAEDDNPYRVLCLSIITFLAFFAYYLFTFDQSGLNLNPYRSIFL